MLCSTSTYLIQQHKPIMQLITKQHTKSIKEIQIQVIKQSGNKLKSTKKINIFIKQSANLTNMGYK